jgi:hypothetical protein
MNLKDINDQLNELTAAGKILESLEQFYAEDCTFQEGNADPRVGKWFGRRLTGFRILTGLFWSYVMSKGCLMKPLLPSYRFHL